MIDNSSIFIVEVTEDNEVYNYEYANIEHATEHYNSEKTATIYEYNKGKYYFVMAK
jgi:hypothetical protein